MESNSDGNGFSGFCAKNLIEFNKETDEMRRAHIQRKVNVEVYHEACAR